MSCGVGCRHGSDLTLLWLWCRPAATAPIHPLAREPPCAMGAALKRQKKKKKKKKILGFCVKEQKLRKYKLLKKQIYFLTSHSKPRSSLWEFDGREMDIQKDRQRVEQYFRPRGILARP